ncbi:hypothetical protein Hanom_Chr13g01217271 [Helianthus anomalus]
MGIVSLGLFHHDLVWGGAANLVGCDNSQPWLSKKSIICLMTCQSDGNVGRNDGVSSILNKSVALVNLDPGTALLDTKNLVLMHIAQPECELLFHFYRLYANFCFVSTSLHLV